MVGRIRPRTPWWPPGLRFVQSSWPRKEDLNHFEPGCVYVGESHFWVAGKPFLAGRGLDADHDVLLASAYRPVGVQRRSLDELVRREALARELRRTRASRGT